MPYTEPLNTAVRKAKYGHRDWLFWRDRAGQGHIAASSYDSMKQALLASGTQKSFTLVASDGCFYRMTWPLAVIHLKHFRYIP